MNRWADTLNEAELEHRYELTARLDPAFARREREFYETRTESQLLNLMRQAWNLGDGDAYQLARTYFKQTV